MSHVSKLRGLRIVIRAANIGAKDFVEFLKKEAPPQRGLLSACVCVEHLPLPHTEQDG